MATTPNYGWTIPAATDYVKDGYSAIDTLGNAVDSSLNSITSGKNVGLVHIGTYSATTASLTVDGCFNSSFDNYRIELMGVGSATTQIYFNFRTAAPATDTAAVHSFANIRANAGSGTINAAIGNSATRLQLTDTTNGMDWTSSFDVLVPNLARASAIQGFANYKANSDFYTVNGVCNNTTVHAGFTVFQNTGNLTSITARVYGYRNS